MKKLFSILLVFSLFLSFALPSLAQGPVNVDPCPQEQGGTVDGQETTNFRLLCFLSPEGGVISNVITIAFIIATLIALAFLIYGGIRWILSGGDKAGVEAARNTIVAALIGLVIVFLSYFILRLVFNLFGIDLGNLQIPAFNIFR